MCIRDRLLTGGRQDPEELTQNLFSSDLPKLDISFDTEPVEQSEQPAAVEEPAVVPAAGTLLLKSDYSGKELPNNYTMDKLSLGDLETVTPVPVSYTHLPPPASFICIIPSDCALVKGCRSFAAVRPHLLRHKKRDQRFLRPRKYYTEKISQKRVRIAAACARVAGASGDKRVPFPEMIPSAFAHWRAGSA